MSSKRRRKKKARRKNAANHGRRPQSRGGFRGPGEGRAELGSTS